MNDTQDQLDVLLALDARHDDLLRRLDDLDRQVLEVLAQQQPASPTAAFATESEDPRTRG